MDHSDRSRSQSWIHSDKNSILAGSCLSDLILERDQISYVVSQIPWVSVCSLRPISIWITTPRRSEPGERYQLLVNQLANCLWFCRIGYWVTVVLCPEATISVRVASGQPCYCCALESIYCAEMGEYSDEFSQDVPNVTTESRRDNQPTLPLPWAINIDCSSFLSHWNSFTFFSTIYVLGVSPVFD